MSPRQRNSTFPSYCFGRTHSCQQCKMFSVAKMQEKTSLGISLELQITGDFMFPQRRSWELRSSGFVTRRVVVIPYRRFGTAYRSQLQGSRIWGGGNSWPLQTEPTGSSETSVRIYRYSPRNNPEERSSQLQNISYRCQHYDRTST